MIGLLMVVGQMVLGTHAPVQPEPAPNAEQTSGKFDGIFCSGERLSEAPWHRAGRPDPSTPRRVFDRTGSTPIASSKPGSPNHGAGS